MSHSVAFAKASARAAPAYVYFEDGPTRRGIAKRLSSADAKAVAQTIARALTEGAKGR